MPDSWLPMQGLRQPQCTACVGTHAVHATRTQRCLQSASRLLADPNRAQRYGSVLALARASPALLQLAESMHKSSSPLGHSHHMLQKGALRGQPPCSGIRRRALGQGVFSRTCCLLLLQGSVYAASRQTSAHHSSHSVSSTGSTSGIDSVGHTHRSSHSCLYLCVPGEQHHSSGAPAQAGHVL